MRVFRWRNVSYLRVGLHPSQLLDVARPAEEVVVEGVTALVGLVGELHLTTLKCEQRCHLRLEDFPMHLALLLRRRNSRRESPFPSPPLEPSPPCPAKEWKQN